MKHSALLVALLTGLSHSVAAFSADSIQVYRLSEGLKLISKGQTQTPAAGTLLEPGTIVVTAETGGAILVLNQAGAQTAVKLLPQTRVRILALEKNELQTQQIEIEEGALIAATQNAGTIKRPFRVKTRTATLGVRGTGFFLKAHQGQPAFLCVCQGEVEVKSRRDTLRFKSKHHDHSMQFTKAEGQLASRLERVPMGNEHSDADGGELNEVLHHF